MNKHYIIGNLTHDPTTGTTPSGVGYCQFSVAVRRRYKPKDGPDAEFIRVTAWRALGDSCAKYLSKGKKVAVVGESVCRVWEGREGQPRGQIEMNADDVEFLTPRGENGAFAPPEEPEWMGAQEEGPKDEATGMAQVETDDLPF